MLFRDRQEAGKLLAEILNREHLVTRNDVVLGLARGGVPVAREIARFFNIPLDVLIIRKIGYPGNEEFAIGAIAPEGEHIFHDIIRDLPMDYLARTIEKESRELDRRDMIYRAGRPPLGDVVNGRNVLLVDDGIATGATMKLAIQTMWKMGARALTVASPVAPRDIMHSLQNMATHVVVPYQPEMFLSVGSFYTQFPQVPDAEVMSCLESL